MKKLLHPDYRLRGWVDMPFFLEYYPDRSLQSLKPEEFVYLLRCDGQTEIDPEAWPPEPEWMKGTEIALPCDGTQKLLPEQEYKKYPNRHFPYIDLSITGRCGMRCRHCFNAPDMEQRTEEPSLEQLKGLFRQMVDCGVGRIRLVGGEVLVRPDFLQVTEEMARLSLRCEDIVTNGLLITEELLDRLEEQGHHPRWFVSFDGVGFHDWLRCKEGAEQRTLESIRLLCDRGYHVVVHQCVWKSSLGSVQKTVQVLRDLGVSGFRVLPVEPSIRWRQNSPEETISDVEWQAWLPGFLTWWFDSRIPMDLDVWGYWQSYVRSGTVRILPDYSSASDVLDHIPLCCDAGKMPFIDSDGRLLLCNALSGITKAYGFPWENVYEKPLQQLFNDSALLNCLKCSCADLKKQNPECLNCDWKNICGMGCRAEALAHGSSIYDIDRRMCHFFKDGVFDQFVAIAERYHLRRI